MTAYIGEVRLFAGSFCPAGWNYCDGSLLPISENDALFNLIGTTYGGDGMNTFAVPDLRGRVPLHMASSFPIGLLSGTETVTLINQQIPVHSHTLQATSNSGTANASGNNVLAATTGATIFAYGTLNPQIAMPSGVIGPVGGSNPHPNIQPYLCIGFIISLFGIYPSQN